MLEVLLAAILGCLAGVVTGMIPGLHVNTLAAGLLAFGAGLSGFSPLSLAAFIVAMAVVHTFVDYVPSLFLGAPDPSTALGVLPGHSLLNQGLGYRALKLTVVGGVGTFAVCLASLPLLFLVLKPVEPLLRSVIPFVLIGISVLFVWREKGFQKRCWAVIIFILSGVLGLLAMENLNVEQGIFPMLTGLFGASALILSSFRKGGVPPQSLRARVSWKGRRSIFNYLRAAVSSLVVSVLPAIGAAQAAGLAKGFRAARDKEDFLMIVGGINTAGVVLTLAVLYLMGKARTGAMVAVGELFDLSLGSFFALIFVAVFAAGVGAILTLLIGKWMILRVERVNYEKLSKTMLVFLAVMVTILTGFVGLAIFVVGSAIGLLAPLSGSRRIHAMGCLIIPVLVWYL